MNTQTMPNNKISKQAKPKTAEGKASRCLRVLLEGGIINRKTLNELGIGAKNDSAHSLISLLRNQRLIPIESQRAADETCNYYMKPEEIIRYTDANLREQQRKEMRSLVAQKRIRKVSKDFSALLDRLSKFPKLWQYLDYLQQQLEGIAKKTNALLAERKGVQ